MAERQSPAIDRLYMAEALQEARAALPEAYRQRRRQRKQLVVT